MNEQIKYSYEELARLSPGDRSTVYCLSNNVGDALKVTFVISVMQDEKDMRNQPAQTIMGFMSERILAIEADVEKAKRKLRHSKVKTGLFSIGACVSSVVCAAGIMHSDVASYVTVPIMGSVTYISVVGLKGVGNEITERTETLIDYRRRKAYVVRVAKGLLTPSLNAKDFG